MSDEPSVHPVELVVSDALITATRQLVLNKYLVDKAVKEHGGDMLGADLYDAAYGPHEPLCFLGRVLPFFYMHTLGSEKRPALVPTSHTLGCSWHKSMTTFAGKVVPSTIHYLTNVDGLLAGALDEASYVWFPDLALAAPMEGKNRVDFLRGQGVDYIPAFVREGQYLAPERIQLYSVSLGAFAETWAVLDGRWVEKVDNPSWTGPVMDAYGVQTHSSWPADFPAAEVVLQAFLGREGVTAPLGHPDHPGRPVADLATLQAVISYREGTMSCRVGQLDQVQVHPRLWVTCGVLVLIALAVLAFAPAGWVGVRVAAAFVLGAGLAAAILPFLPFLMTQRQRVGHAEHLPLDLAPKRVNKPGRRLR